MFTSTRRPHNARPLTKRANGKAGPSGADIDNSTVAEAFMSGNGHTLPQPPIAIDRRRLTGEHHDSHQHHEPEPGRHRLLGSQFGPGRRGRCTSAGFPAAGAARTRRQGIPDPPKHRKAEGILFYEVFAGEAAFADHQQTEHFKNIIVGQAIAKLAKRERSQFRFI